MSALRLTSSLLLTLTFAATLGGCWKDDMSDDAHAKPLEASPFFADGKLARPLINGTVPRGHNMISDPMYAVTAPDNAMETANFFEPMNAQRIARGREQYTIFCSVCHGALGDGNGMVVQRGFPRPPSLVKWIDRPLTEREVTLQSRPPGHYFNVITHGYGAMYSYGDRIKPADRWNIVGYIRALQLGGPQSESKGETPAVPGSTQPAAGATAAPPTRSGQQVPVK